MPLALRARRSQLDSVCTYTAGTIPGFGVGPGSSFSHAGKLPLGRSAHVLSLHPPIVRRTHPADHALSLEWAWGDGAPSLLLARGAETTLDPIRREQNGLHTIPSKARFFPISASIDGQMDP